MRRPAIDAELPAHLLAKRSLRQHPLDGAFDKRGGVPLEEDFGTLGFQPTWISGVAVVDFFSRFISGQHNFGGIYHDNMIAGVDVRGKRGLMFAMEEDRHLSGHTPERL